MIRFGKNVKDSKVGREPRCDEIQDNATILEAQKWFETHVTLEGKPYTLDFDQARAAIDLHRNTLVTARAGSGKTRVIVAKIAFLVAQKGYKLSEIAAFMFNRTAAAEVNQRIGSVLVDGRSLREISNDLCKADTKENKECVEENSAPGVTVASTFHKYALEIVKMYKMRPQIISEQEQANLIQRLLREYLVKKGLKFTTARKNQYMQLISGFITRAGQQFPGIDGLRDLHAAVEQYCQATDSEWRQLHRIALAVYEGYLGSLAPPKIDFNLLMSVATQCLTQYAESSSTERSQYPEFSKRIEPLRYLLVDEYQDFSFLFFGIIQATRKVCPEAHLFAVGDDWQAINRFAGSDCDYFLNFAKYFPEDTINIPLATNYRSDRTIVEHANTYMLENYDPEAIRAQPFSKETGKVYHVNPQKTRFDATDILEDGLGDGNYQNFLSEAILEVKHSNKKCAKDIVEIAQLVKTIAKIIRKNRNKQIMLLHRHNFTSYAEVDLQVLGVALKKSVVAQGIMSHEDYERQIRIMTMHKSKGLESDVVILLEFNREIVASMHPHASIFTIFGDGVENERLDQCRLTYVALTRAKHKLYILSSDKKTIA